MKKSIQLSVLVIITLSFNTVFPQIGFDLQNGYPLKQGDSPMFGKDIIIHDMPDKNQRNIAICSAFNGWLYAFYSRDGQYEPWLTLLRSMDGGITWEILREGTSLLPHCIIMKTDIITTSTDLDHLKVFCAYLGYDTIGGYRPLYFSRFNGITGDYEMTLPINAPVNDVALASDGNYPGTSADSGSIAIIYSKYNSVSPDSIIFRASVNNGNTFVIYRAIASTTGYFHKVALSYGYSPTLNTGRYYAAWENQANENSQMGSIYTSHTEPGISNPFTQSYCVDCNVPSMAGKIRNPVIVT